MENEEKVAEGGKGGSCETSHSRRWKSEEEEEEEELAVVVVEATPPLPTPTSY